MRRVNWMGWAVLAAGVVVVSARANERRFTYAYDTAVLPPGAKELEVTVEPGVGRASRYLRFDNRIELELGLTHRLQTSLYLNFGSVIVDQVKQASSDWSLSNEWKYKLLDPVADPVGLGVYAELTAGFHTLELEGKVLLDKRSGPWLAALNLVGAHEWELGEGAPVREEELEADAGVTYFFSPALSLGLEGRTHSILSTDEGYEGTAFFLGPVVTWAGPSAWVSLSLTPQIAGIHPGPVPVGASSLELNDHERFTGRLIFGIHV